ncbi:ceramide synthase 2-like [Scleropages formosus]|uniref:Ceramide synthase 2-like n=1 Tax=Scleropages formosus TaxID=113540 RepID=A0A0P7UG57_SCLFO|nr:ceramide synthase 2-like [Scleropages formosus]
MLAWLSDCFWQERLWFPEGLGWADLQDRDGRVYAKAADLWVTIPLALCFLVVRQVFERTVAVPLASLLGVREKVRVTATHNPTLESYFCEVTKHPTQTLLPSQYWYYMLELSFYVSLLFSVATDVKRKDFKEQIVHHVATIVLISFSWCVNYIRAGTLIMLVHDASDYLLESAKMFNYAGWRTTCNCMFILFAAVFFVTRLIIFPLRILYCTWVYPVTMYPPFFGYYFFNGLLLLLQCLHIFWALLILRMVIKFLPGNVRSSTWDVVADERSDKEETDESEEEEEGAKLENGSVQNGHPALYSGHCKTE